MHDQLRAGQLLGPFGPGAMVDLPDGAVLVGGLETWYYGRGTWPRIEEPRLQAKLRALLGVGDLALRPPPPACDDPHATDRPGVKAWRFPCWFVANCPEHTRDEWLRRPLVHLDSIKHQQMKYRHPVTRKSSRVVAVRFVRACRKGHLADLDWPAFVHGRPNPDCVRQLWLEERGTSGDLRDIWAVCDCGAARQMTDATLGRAGALGYCRGEQPWLGPDERNGCNEPSRLLIRTASNAWFAQVMSVLSIPETEDRGADVVKRLWSTYFEQVDDLGTLATLRSAIPLLDQELGDLDNEEVLAAVRAVRAGADDTVVASGSVKAAEFDALAAAPLTSAAMAPPKDEFDARALPSNPDWPSWMAPVERVVLVHRLRQVTALVGFTRFEAAGPDTSGELDPQVERAPLSRHERWVPASENRGEGIFLLFRAAAVEEWASRPEVQARERQHRQGHDLWRREHQSQHRAFPGAKYYLMHSLSHLLMTAIALDCGYPCSSLTERVYAEPGKYGILILTGSSDSEGTLGGLVDAGRRIEAHLRRALELGSLCSNDPVCAGHAPGDQAHQLLHGSACHGCLLIAETSCEQSNDYLDRSLVVPTMGQPPATALFDLP
ncbi:MAG: DUF1998 domain-containing protein [Fimbriimonadaceae bacterium]|nr:DUF1998 domain-containing protein [Fimbriimonadaceae bacterium]